jgi:hypothetical protein
LLAGCPEVLSPSKTAGGRVLVVHIAGESPAGRTALPSMPGSPTYTISVTRSSPGDLGIASFTGAGPFYVQLNDDPGPGDMVKVEGFIGGVQWAEGSDTLPAGYAGTPFPITLQLLTGGTGSVDLAVGLPAFTGDNRITAAELSLYRSLQKYRNGEVYRFVRYQETVLEPNLGGSVPLAFTGLPSGTYVVKIDFFRFNGVRVSRLTQSLIVRNGLTTGTWSPALNWTADKFASSNANLAGISIDGTPIAGYNAGKTTYAEYKGVFSFPAIPSSIPITITPAETGQTVTAWLNGNTDSEKILLDNDFTGTLSPLNAANSMVIMVTAPDGVTKQTYTVSYTYFNATEWTINPSISPIPSAHTFSTVTAALGDVTYGVKAVYNHGTGWPDTSNPVAARINIAGEITDAVVIADSGVYADYPPIILMGSDITRDKIKATSSDRPLTIDNATVILGDGLALTGGNGIGEGGGVHVSGGGSFTMNGGTINGNTVTGTSDGGGVYVTGSSFTMNGGTISGNTTTNDGGGVYITGTSGSTFTMNGGTISGNPTAHDGGGVFVTGAGNSFTMNTGTISGHTTGGSGGGGGVVVKDNATFTMKGGSLNGNSAQRGGGVLLPGDGTFIMEGGSISDNEATGSASWDSGGGVRLLNAGNSFTMSGGTISGNTATGTHGGGVYVDDGCQFTMSGESSVSGNNATGKGGGVYVEDTGSSFTMNNQSGVSGNSAEYGGGVYMAVGTTFTMNNQSSVNGNIATGDGGGVYVADGASFTMNDQSGVSANNADGGGGVYVTGANGSFAMTNSSSISGNKALSSGTNYGGGVLVVSAGVFTMSGGTISGNSATNTVGGGVCLRSADSFTMSGGTISGNDAIWGGGVFNTESNFTMSGGTISGNTAAAAGAGVYVFPGGGAFNMGGMGTAPLIDQDNDVWLATGKTINISGSLSSGLGGPSHVARITPAYTAGTPVLSDSVSGSYVFSYHGKFTFTPQGDGTNWKVDSSGLLQLE